MRFRANSLINTRLFASEAGKRFAQDLMDQRLTWGDLQIQLTGIKAGTFTSGFWLAFKKELEENAPGILPDIRNVDWICDDEFQEDNIKRWLD
jgi:hypothetical protein